MKLKNILIGGAIAVGLAITAAVTIIVKTKKPKPGEEELSDNNSEFSTLDTNELPSEPIVPDSSTPLTESPSYTVLDERPGIVVEGDVRHIYTREELLEKLRSFYNDNGFVDSDYFSKEIGAIVTNFGSWNNAVILAGGTVANCEGNIPDVDSDVNPEVVTKTDATGKLIASIFGLDDELPTAPPDEYPAENLPDDYYDGTCVHCGETYDVRDMETIDGKLYCAECNEEINAAVAEANVPVEEPKPADEEPVINDEPQVPSVDDEELKRLAEIEKKKKAEKAKKRAEAKKLAAAQKAEAAADFNE